MIIEGNLATVGIHVILMTTLIVQCVQGVTYSLSALSL